MALSTKGYSEGLLLAGPYVKPGEIEQVNVTGVDLRYEVRVDEVKIINGYLVKRVLSPFEFYLEYEMDSKKTDGLALEQEMQKYYNDKERLIREYTIEVVKWRCYACQDSFSKMWCRVRIIDFIIEETEEGEEGEGDVIQVFVFFCDTGKQGYVPASSLRQLRQKYQDWRSPLFRCYLFDVMPKNGGYCWSMEAITFFREMMTGKKVSGVVSYWSREEVRKYHENCMAMNCGVVLFRMGEEKGDTINRRMVDEGFAQPLGIMASSGAILNLPGMAPSFEYVEKPKPPKPGPVGPIPLEELHKITSNAIAHFNYKEGVVQEYNPVWAKEPQKYLPVAVRERLAWVKMSYIGGPDRLFVQMQMKVKEFHKMYKEMKEDCKNLGLKPLLLQEIQVGLAVACEMKYCWTRGVIVKLNRTTRLAEVIFVDYGNTEVVPFKKIRQLPERFRSIPSFAHRVHLESVCPPPQGQGLRRWHEDTTRVFVKYVMSFELGVPLYFCHVPPNKKTVQLQDFQQGLAYDGVGNTWIADPKQIPDQSAQGAKAAVNSMKDDPLMASFFQSFPVDIRYEVGVKMYHFWDFDGLHEYLIERNHGHLVDDPTRKETSKTEIYNVITSSYD